MLAVFQLLLIYLISIDIKKVGELNKPVEQYSQGKKIEKKHNISMLPGSYYDMKKRLFLTKGWGGFREYLPRNRQEKFLGIKVPLEMYRRNSRMNRHRDSIFDPEAADKAVKRIKFRYYRIGFLMIAFPILNLLINLLYIFEYSLPFELPFPDTWMDNFERVVKLLERLWKYQWLAVIMCLIEIAIAATIYYRIFGLPSPINFFKSIFSKL